jgi:hypothetical protein
MKKRALGVSVVVLAGIFFATGWKAFSMKDV